jgi:hypothetical protein
MRKEDSIMKTDTHNQAGRHIGRQAEREKYMK